MHRTLSLFGLGLIVFGFSLTIAGSTATAARDTHQDLTLRSTFWVAPTPLTTELIWNLDPTEPNPHRQFWMLERRLQLEGLKARALVPNFGVKADHLAAGAALYLRPEGSRYYSELADFPCARTKPDDRFSTRAGALAAGQAAAEAWEKLLRDGRIRLALRLDRLRTKTAEGALIEARGELGTWILGLEDRFDREIMPQVRAQEWTTYRESAEIKAACAKKAKASQTAPAGRSWTAMMEPPAKVKDGPVLLARAPARRWAGRYSVRLAVKIGTNELLGQFLVDTSATHSLISPFWLRSQGIDPKSLRIQGEHPEKLAFSLGHGVGTPIQVDSVTLAGQKLSVRRFLLSDTEDLLGAPEFVGPCCDGILNAAFLRDFAVELVPGPPSAIELYERHEFARGDGWKWAEMSLDLNGAPISDDCVIDARPGAKGPKRLKGGFWQTALLAEASAPAPAQNWQYRGLVCDGVKVVEGLEFRTKKPMGLDAISRAQFSLGARLAERGNLVLDAPHGRVWFSPALLEHPRAENLSGLELEVKKALPSKGGRELVVRRIMAGSLAARQLNRSGLKVGTPIAVIDAVPTAEMDVWEADRHLRGAYGKKVVLQWKSPKRETISATLVLETVSGVHSTGSDVLSPIPNTEGSLLNPKPFEKDAKGERMHLPRPPKRMRPVTR